jgi:hypothetical protein
MFQSTAIILALCLANATPQSALTGRIPAAPNGTDYQTYYDGFVNITMLADVNLAASNSSGVTKIDFTAQTWITGTKAANFLGGNSWRRPTSADVGPPGRY